MFYLLIYGMLAVFYRICCKRWLLAPNLLLNAADSRHYSLSWLELRVDRVYHGQILEGGVRVFVTRTHTVEYDTMLWPYLHDGRTKEFAKRSDMCIRLRRPFIMMGRANPKEPTHNNNNTNNKVDLYHALLHHKRQAQITVINKIHKAGIKRVDCEPC